MRAVFLAGLIMALVVSAGDGLPVSGQVPKDKSKEPPREAVKSGEKGSALAEFTRTRLLKARMTVSYQDERLGEILKELAGQVDMQNDQPVMWVYGMGFPFSQKVSFACKDKPLDVVLDQLLTKAGGGLGYVVTSREGDKYDGWVRLTTTGERGTAKGMDPATAAADETAAAEKLGLAKKLIAAGKPASARPVLEIIVKSHPTTKAAVEARELLEKMEK